MVTSYRVLNGEEAKSRWRPLERQSHLSHCHSQSPSRPILVMFEKEKPDSLGNFDFCPSEKMPIFSIYSLAFSVKIKIIKQPMES